MKPDRSGGKQRGHAGGSPVQPPVTGASQSSPRFYVTPRQRFSTGSVLLAIVVAVIALFATSYALSHSHHGRFSQGGSLHLGSSGDDDDDDDDPSRVDTIYLGDPAEAPVPTRPGGRPRSVHPFVVVHLPRSGTQTGQIPATSTGHLLYDWLAAFNKADYASLAQVLPSAAPDATNDAQMELRKQTGGFTLLSAKEVQPGVLVFRMHDQTAAETEVLGTLTVRPGSVPPTIESFGLRAVPPSPASVK